MLVKALVALLIATLGAASLGCENRMRPKTAVVQQAGDSSISRMVKAALVNEPTIRYADIRVKTITGNVLLRGSVMDEAQLNRVVQIVSAIAGVKIIYNQLIVKPSSTRIFVASQLTTV